MGFNAKVLMHVAGLLLTLLLLVWVWENTRYYATLLTLSLVLCVQVNALLKLVSTTNREVSRFLAAVKYADFSQSFRGARLRGSFRELGEAFDGVLERLRLERSDKEEQAAWLQAFVQQLPIAVLALREDGRITVSNQALQRLLNGRQFPHLDQLTDYDPALGQFLAALTPGRHHSFKLKRPYGTLQLKVTCTLLRQRGQQHRLISLLDISSELESQELEAWHNLIRVMTHEIMNSLTPLTSLADTARSYVDEARERLQAGERDKAAAHAEQVLPLLEDASNAAATIGKRGQGLLRFVQSYRTLSRLPQPRLQTFRVADLLQRVTALMNEQTGKSVAITAQCVPDTLELHADPELLEQALINLVKNGLDAMSGVVEPQLMLRGELRERGQVAITVRDNGSGMDAETLSNMFVPFYTTKRGGSGIGMTLTKQIVHLNKGTIHVESSVGQGTTITLLF